MTPDAAMHYSMDIITLDRAARRSKRKVKHPCYELILATMRRKSVPQFEKVR
jgi:hypothetical protein